MKALLQIHVTPEMLSTLCIERKIDDVLVFLNDQGRVVSIKLYHSDSRLHKNSVWHETSYHELRQFVNEGLTYQQIGDLFGVSKSMVQYKINKLLSEWRKKQGLV